MCRTYITMEYLWEQIKKGTGHLEDVFIDSSRVKQDRIFSPHTEGIQVQRFITETQQGQGADTRIDMSDSKQNCNIRNDKSKRDGDERKSRLQG